MLSDTGHRQQVRLGNVARIENGQTPGEIQRIGQRQVFIIEGDLSDGASLGEALDEVEQVLATVTLPDGVTRLPNFGAQSNAAITGGLGMFPLALGIGEGSEFLQPLGVVVFSGLSLATLLTLFIIPCFYTLLHGRTNDKNVPVTQQL